MDYQYHHIVNKTFQFSNKDGHLGQITLAADGKIKGYDNQNERTWTF